VVEELEKKLLEIVAKNAGEAQQKPNSNDGGSDVDEIQEKLDSDDGQEPSEKKAPIQQEAIKPRKGRAAGARSNIKKATSKQHSTQRKPQKRKGVVGKPSRRHQKEEDDEDDEEDMS